MNEAKQSSALNLRHYVQAIWRRKWLILQFVIVIPALVLVVSLRQTKVYDATARVMVESPSSSVSLIAGQNLSDRPPDDRTVATLAGFAATPEIAQTVIDQLALTTSWHQLLKHVSATPDTNANVIMITASDHSAQQAATIANAFAQAFVTWRQTSQQSAPTAALEAVNLALTQVKPGSSAYQSLVAQRSQLSVLIPLTTGGVGLGEKAEAPTSPASPKPLRTTFLAIVAALIIGIGIAFLREALDVKIHTLEQLHEFTQLPIIGTIAALPKGYQQGDKLVTLDDPRSPAAESFRFLRTNVGFMNFNHDVKSILATSPLPGQGKSTTIANLAVVMLRGGLRVAVVEGDLRRPALHRFFHVDNARGLTSVIAGQATMAEASHLLTFRDGGAPVGPSERNDARFETVDNADAARDDALNIIERVVPDAHGGTAPKSDGLQLQLLTSGPLPPNPGELVTSQQLADVIDALKQNNDYVLIDAPPLFAVGDATALAGRVDGVLVIVNLESTTRDMIRQIEEFFARIPARKMGLVVTGIAADTRSRGYNTYYE
jgi:capsular polysaccharide biosynthesis protein/Mrp family chromosome partitioning ATPase